MLRAIAFDFDGVLAESVDVKTRAFARLFARETPRAIHQIVHYHLKYGGVSRFEKIRTIYRTILKRPLSHAAFRFLCKKFSNLVVDEVVTSRWVPGAQTFLRTNRNCYRFFLISGTPENELKRIVKRRKMGRYFEDILGSPSSKETLLRKLLKDHRLRPSEIVYVGDSATDWTAAQKNRVPFIWRRLPRTAYPLHHFKGPCIPSLKNLAACLSTLKIQNA